MSGFTRSSFTGSAVQLVARITGTSRGGSIVTALVPDGATGEWYIDGVATGITDPVDYTIPESADGLPLTFEYAAVLDGGVVAAAVVAVVNSPTFSTQPTLTGGTVGDTLTITEGVAAPDAVLTIHTFELDNVDKTGELSGLTWDSTGETAGTVRLIVAATNSGDTTLSDTITATLADLPVQPADLAPEVVLVSEDFGAAPYDDSYMTVFSGENAWPFAAQGTITQLPSEPAPFAGQTAGVLQSARGSGPEYQTIGVLFPIDDPAREYEFVVRGRKDNLSGSFDQCVERAEWLDVSGAVISQLFSNTIGQGEDVELSQTITDSAPANAAYLLYAVRGRISRARVEFSDIQVTQLAEFTVPSTPNVANFTVTDANEYPGDTVFINYLQELHPNNAEIFSLQYRLDSGSGYGLWVELPDVALGTYPITVLAEATVTIEVRAANRAGVSVAYELPSITPAYPTPVAVNQTATFGALTLEGTDTFKAIDNNFQEIDVVSYDSLVSGSLGVHTPTIVNGGLAFTGADGAPDGAVLRCTLADTSQIDITIATEADTYTMRDDAGYLAVMALPSATLSGKTAKGRPGRAQWDRASMETRNFTDFFTIASTVPENMFTLYANQGVFWRDPDNQRFYQMRITGVREPVGSLPGLLNGQGGVGNLEFIECDLDGGRRESFALYGGEGGSWRGIFNYAGNYLFGNMKVVDCQLHGSWRLGNWPGLGAEGSGSFEFTGNEIYDYTVDGSIFTGQHYDSLTIAWNRIFDPAINDIIPVEVLSVDVANNQMTINDPENEFGTSGTRATNINANTVSMPDGLGFPGQGGGDYPSHNDYQVTTISANGDTKVVQFNTDILSAGSGVFINQEPAHADGIQFVTGAGEDQIGTKIYGNVLLGKAGGDGSWPQGFFLEDIAQADTEGHYTEAQIVGNTIYTNVLNGLFLANSIRGVMADNTVVGPPDGSYEIVTGSGAPQINFGDQFGWGGFNNVATGNLSRGTVSSYAQGGDLIADNVDVLPSGYDTAPLVGTGGFNAKTVDQLLAAFARTDLDGSIDYVARTMDLPSFNTPNDFTFADAIGMAATVVTTSDRITQALNRQGEASAFGIQAAVASADGAAPELRITSDAIGTTVVQDWTSQPAIMQAGQYLWVSGTTGAASEDREVSVRVGDRVQIWTLSAM